jgi:hypothetical protein
MLRSAFTFHRTECNWIRHETRQNPNSPSVSVESAAWGVTRLRRQKFMPNASGVRLFKDQQFPMKLKMA